MYQTSLFCLDAGMSELAGPFIDYGLKIAPDAKVRDAFAKLREALPFPMAPAKSAAR